MSSAVHDLPKRGANNLTVPNIKGDFPVDVAVAKALPEGEEIISATAGGASAWAITARLDVKTADGSNKQWFLKCATDDLGKKMVAGEYESMRAMYEAAPLMTAKPYCFGQFEYPDPPTYFFVGQYIEMDNELPDPAEFTKLLADLHRSSESPNGKFGFHIPTCHGKFPNAVEWDSSWVSFYTKLLAEAIRIDKTNNLSWPELDILSERTLSKVVPLVLGSLESEGRSVKPSLIHGDLWEGNIGTDIETGNIILFDAGSYFAHNEMEIGMWRCKRHRINNKNYIRQYLARMPPSEPADMWDDRNRLYNLKMDFIHSAHHEGAPERQHVFDSMLYLIDKYAPFPPEEKPQITSQPLRA